MATDTALVTITVDATVQANDDTATTPANTPVSIDVLANDIVNGVTGPTVDDLNGPPTILSITPEDAGTATVNADGEIEFTPASGFCGQVQIEYSIEKTCDASTDCAITVVLGGNANINSTPFEAPGFEWGVTPEFGLFHPDIGEIAYFEWDGDEEIYFNASGVGCGEEPQPGWTLEVDGAAPSDVCVMAGCS
jgi:hypothetical protein